MGVRKPEVLMTSFRRLARNERNLVFGAPLRSGLKGATFTRASEATFLNNDTRLVDTAAIDEARFVTYNGKAGLLREGAATNLIEYSEDFTNAFWTIIDVGDAVGGSTVAPDGSTTTKGGLIADNTDAQHGIRATYLNLNDDTSYTFSVYAKPGDRDWLVLQLLTKAAGYKATYFDLANGALGNSGNDDKGIEDAGNGWYRCWITEDIDSGATSPQTHAMPADGNADSSIVGDSSTVNTYVWGAQLEETPYPTSYIPTGGYTEKDDETGVPEYRIIAKDGEAAIGFGNMVAQPEDFNTWLGSRITIGGSVTTPDGLTGITNGIIATAEEQPHYLFLDPTLSDDASYTFSIYAKAGNKDWLALRQQTKAGGTPITYFDLANGVLGATKQTDDEGIESIGNGWYRCWITQDVGSGGSTPRISIFTAEANGDYTFTGDGATVDIYLWGAMLTEGTEPVPYLPYYNDGNSRIVLTDGNGAEVWAWIGEPDAVEAYTNIVTDDCEDDDKADWTLVDCTITHDTDHYEIVYVGSTQYVYRINSTTAGRFHRVTIDFKDGNSAGVNTELRLSRNSVAIWEAGVDLIVPHATTAAWTSVTGYVTAMEASSRWGLKSFMVGAGDFEIDNLAIDYATALGLSAVHVYDNRYTQDATRQNWIGDTVNFEWNDIAAMEIEQANAATQTSRATEEMYPQWTQPPGVIAAIGGGGEGSMICEIIQLNDNADIPAANIGVIGTTGVAHGFLYFASGGEMKSHDGTSLVNRVVAWGYGDSVRVGLIWGSNGKFQLGISLNGAAWSWGPEVNYDGAFTSDGTLYIGWLNIYPFILRNLKMYDVKYSTARIEQMSGG